MIQKKMECLYKDNKLQFIVRTLKDEKTSNSTYNRYLNLLSNTVENNEKIRDKLLKTRIFDRIFDARFQNEETTEETVVAHSSLIVALMNQSGKAQNQVRESGCLARLVDLLKNTLVIKSSTTINQKLEFLVYAVIASIWDPWNITNQTIMGNLIPKILTYFLDDLTYASNGNISLKFLWKLLRCILYRNKLNHRILIKSNGSEIMFRILDALTSSGNIVTHAYSLRCITDVLIILKYQKQILEEAASVHVISIFCKLFEIKNSYINRNILQFLDSLTEETPCTVEILRSLRGDELIQDAVSVKRNSSSIPQECAEILLLKLSNSTNLTEENSVTNTNNHFNGKQINPESMLGIDITSALPAQSQTSDSNRFNDTRIFNVAKRKEIQFNKSGSCIHHKHFNSSHQRFHKRELREKEKRLRQMIRHALLDGSVTKQETPKEVKKASLIMNIMKTPTVIVQKCWSYFSNKKRLNYIYNINRAHEEALRL